MNLITTSTVALFGASVLAAGAPFATSAPFGGTSHSSKPLAGTVAVAQTVTAPVSAAPAEPAKPQIITVQPGDYLEKLAIANDTTSLRLYYANTDITNPDLIFPDQQLRVPTADEPLTPRDVPLNQQIATPTTVESTQAAAPQATAYQAPAPATDYVPVSSDDASVWDRIAACESGGNWAISTGNGFYGGLQFTLSSWRGVGGSGYPNEASREEQIARAQMLQARQGWGAWPACTAKLGIR